MTHKPCTVTLLNLVHTEDPICVCVCGLSSTKFSKKTYKRKFPRPSGCGLPSSFVMVCSTSYPSNDKQTNRGVFLETQNPSGFCITFKLFGVNILLHVKNIGIDSYPKSNPHQQIYRCKVDIMGTWMKYNLQEANYNYKESNIAQLWDNKRLAIGIENEYYSTN